MAELANAAAEVTMPRLSDSMEEGTILAWSVGVGDRVEAGQEIAEIETDKANMTYQADVTGTVTEIVVTNGECVPVGAVIARIDRADGRPSSSRQASAPPAATAQGGRPERVKASPLARRVARDAGIDLGAVTGTGAGGRIARRDVEAVMQSPGESPRLSPAGGGAETAKGEVTVREPSRAQQVVARRMAESKATVPHFYLTAEIEMEAAMAARSRLKQLAGDGASVPSVNDLVVKACALALRALPKANGAYRDGHFELHSRVNVGIAVAGQQQLAVPTIFDADEKGLRAIAAEAKELAAKVRSGAITPPELAGGTFTVSNLGMLGIEQFGAVVNMPQAAILAIGAVREAPVVRAGQIVPAQLMTATLSCDHRILYGAEGAELLARVKTFLEEPLALAL